MNFLKKNFVKITLFTFLAFVAFTPSISSAQCDPSKGLCNPISYDTINDFIKAILEGALKIGMPIIALAIIYSGFLFVFAQGNESKLKEAKNALLYSLIGAAILLGAWSIAILISETVIKVGS